METNNIATLPRATIHAQDGSFLSLGPMNTNRHYEFLILTHDCVVRIWTKRKNVCLENSADSFNTKKGK